MENPQEQSDLLRPRTGADSSASVEELRSQYQQLQTLFVAALAALFVLGMVCCLFMFKQYRMIRAQVEDQRPTVQRMWSDYQGSSEKLIRDFVGSLQNFAMQHRDFQPILDRYREPLRSYFVPSVPGPPDTKPASQR